MLFVAPYDIKDALYSSASLISNVKSTSCLKIVLYALIFTILFFFAVGSEFGGVNLLDGPTGLTPCHQQQPTAFQVTSLNTPLGDGRNFENL